jgi:hypothetical protein
VRPLRVICLQPIVVVISQPFAIRSGLLPLKRDLYLKDSSFIDLILFSISY